jgi:hypothetical protein
MTREIALHCMKSYSELHSDLCELCPIYGETGSDHCFEDALQYVIGMLEQEPILDKLRAEIEAEPYVSKMEVLDIIDKYKAESEDT